MRKSRFTESQIVGILGISCATYFNWRSKYAGTSVAELKLSPSQGVQGPLRESIST